MTSRCSFSENHWAQRQGRDLSHSHSMARISNTVSEFSELALRECFILRLLGYIWDFISVYLGAVDLSWLNFVQSERVLIAARGMPLSYPKQRQRLTWTSQTQTRARPLIQVRNHHQMSITHIIKANSDFAGNAQPS